MQDLKRAVIVGTKTFGKGVMQTPRFLKDGSELYLTTAHTPIDKAGITPDVYVEEAPDESCTGDRQLAVALDVLRKKSAERTIVAEK